MKFFKDDLPLTNPAEISEELDETLCKSDFTKTL
jgi:hypothetical protein